MIDLCISAKIYELIDIAIDGPSMTSTLSQLIKDLIAHGKPQIFKKIIWDAFLKIPLEGHVLELPYGFVF